MILRKKLLPALIGIGAVLLGWHLVCATGVVNAYVLPSPGKVWETFLKMAVSGELLKGVIVSLLRVLKGFAIAFTLAFLLASLRILLPGSEPYYEYIVQFFRNVPPIAMIPLLILWCGIGETTKTVIIVLASFFPMYLSIVKGFTGCDPKLLEVARSFGCYASFMPKPLRDDCGNGMHIGFNIIRDSDFLDDSSTEPYELLRLSAAGIIKNIKDFTIFTNSIVNSYSRLAEFSAPREIKWSHQEGEQIIRIYSENSNSSVMLRVADCVCNPYYTFGLMIYAALDGIENNLELPAENVSVGRLPENLSEAVSFAENSQFLRKYIPENIISYLLHSKLSEWKEYSSAYDKESFEEKKYFYSL